MLERLGFGDHHYDDDVVDYNPGSEEEFDEDYEDEHQERVEHRADHPADDAETGLDAQFGRWARWADAGRDRSCRRTQDTIWHLCSCGRKSSGTRTAVKVWTGVASGSAGEKQGP